MRSILALFLLSSLAIAADWDSYENSRFGATIDIPPGFVNDVPEPANGDGLTFHSVDRKAELLVWGNNLVDEDFNQDVAARLKSDAEDGWNISYVAGSMVLAGRSIRERAKADCSMRNRYHPARNRRPCTSGSNILRLKRRPMTLLSRVLPNL